MKIEDIEKAKFELERLLRIVDELREKCPWDKIQTFDSLKHLTIEELYELLDAITSRNFRHIKEELGDVFLHLLFYIRLSREEDSFDFSEVMSALSDKLIYRHPHIYENSIADDPDAVRKNWEQLKLKDNPQKSILSGVPKGLPAIVKALRIQEKAKAVGFEWENIDQVWEKVEEEIGEVKSSILTNDKAEIEMELGDLFFALINYARFLNIDPETALEKVNQKFIYRFQYIEQNADKPMVEMTLSEMELLWQAAKKSS
jgi:XTP/dITP diphosphohydrolase